jgi:hypothetical protein
MSVNAARTSACATTLSWSTGSRRPVWIRVGRSSEILRDSAGIQQAGDVARAGLGMSQPIYHRDGLASVSTRMGCWAAAANAKSKGTNKRDGPMGRYRVTEAAVMEGLLWVNVGGCAYPPYMYVLVLLTGLGDIVGGLHPHQRIHLHAKGFLNA